jgi:hypothetical protein
LNERLGPQLAQAVEMLSRAPSQFDRVLTEARNVGTAQQMEDSVRALNALLERMKDRPN